MVQRTKRSLHLGKIEEMQREVKDFELKVRQWAAEVPIESSVYLERFPIKLHHILPPRSSCGIRLARRCR